MMISGSYFWFALIGICLIDASNSFGQYGMNLNSCVDSCTDGFKSKFKIDLTNGKFNLKDSHLVEILEEHVKSNSAENTECSKNILLRIPFIDLPVGTIVKIELDYGDLAEGASFHFGNSPTNDLNGGDRNTTMYNAEIYANGTNLSFYMSSVNLCDQEYSSQPPLADLSKVLLLNESHSYINPKSKIIVYISEKWFRIDNLEKKSSFYYNNDFLFTFDHNATLSEKCSKNILNKPPYNRRSPFLYIGLNRAIADTKVLPGNGVCKADISFLNCHMNVEPDMDIKINEMTYKSNDDNKTITWVNPLNYLEPSMVHSPCSGQGIVKLKFEQNSTRKIARFDLDFGKILSGFTFNFGDSPTNNAYGGDSGSTSNSAEMHSNDNRFYVWLNTKYCGDTLLYKIEYNLFQSYDKITIFISDQRIEITNSRGYHEILKNPYLYNLNGQNVTCNCFDTRCYAGVLPDDDLYFGINRVIGGTYRPGIGLCNAKISWLQCQDTIIDRNATKIVNFDYVDWFDKELNVSNTASNNTNSSESISSRNDFSLKLNETNFNTSLVVNQEVLTSSMPNLTIINSTILNETTVEAVSSNQTKQAEKNPCSKENIQNKIVYHEYKLDKFKFIFCDSIDHFKILSCPLKMKWSQVYQQCLDEDV